MKIKSDDRLAQILNNHEDYRNPITINDLSIGLHIITCRDLLSLINDNVICYYENNRGGGRIKDVHVQNMYNNFEFDGLGQFTCALYPEDKKLIALDAHHRMVLLCQMAINNTLEPYWLDELSLKIVIAKKAKSVYQILNNMKAHSEGEFLKNKDLGYGKLISQLISQAESQTGIKINLVVENLKILCILIYAIYKNRDKKDSYISNWSYDNVWAQNHNPAMIDLRKAKPEISNCKINDLTDLSDGLCLIFEYLNKLHEKKTEKNINLKPEVPDSKLRERTIREIFPKIITSTGVIGYLLCAGSRKTFRVDSEDLIWFDDINNRQKELQDILKIKPLGLPARVDFSRVLDKAIFGANKVSKKAIRYWPQK